MSIKYSRDHEWIDVSDPDRAIIGITFHAQEALGDVVFVDLPELGGVFSQGEIAGVVESVKAAADVYMPVDGEIVEVNKTLFDDPSLVNNAPLDDGWFFKIKIINPQQLDELLDEAAYEAFSQQE